ncbi:TOM1-like protein 2 [Euphorbia lathyris]|uniref:TOM1-like protein 2 n=1 Tax=Euphorbia lathyris TaxID=212925 RepID=UPI003313CCEA
MDKSKISQWGERLKIGGAQMSRLVSDKMKEILQTPTPESKMVDEATAETLEESNWGLNLRICAMINSEEFNGTEIVRAIKKKLAGKSSVSQTLSLDLLEACTMNCEKVFSEVASEKVLDEMVKMIENPQTDQGNRDRAAQLIRAWGQSVDLEYLPVFRQTYMSLQERNVPQAVEDGNSLPMQHSLESYIHQQPLPPPERYPFPETEFDANSTAFGYESYDIGNQSVEEKNEYLVTTRNSIELLSSILNAESETKAIKEDLTVSLLEKCRQSQPVIQRIIESTTNDEAMLFEALNLNDELQQVVSRYEELEACLKSEEQQPEKPDDTRDNVPVVVQHDKDMIPEDSLKGLSIDESSKNKGDESSSKNKDESSSKNEDESSSNSRDESSSKKRDDES